jgi:organic radical activating enzyme
MKQINIQPIEKQNLDQSGNLSVHSVFYTIQGEGPFTGRPAVFLRLAGCNLQCPSCDTNYTIGRESMTLHEIEVAVAHACRDTIKPSVKPLVVITGGEPFRQNIAKLVRSLGSKGYHVQIETNGTLYVPELPWDSVTIVCSPKAGKISPLLTPHIDAYKYVMSADSVDPEDGLPILALDHTAKPKVARPFPGNSKPIYLQPMDPGMTIGPDEHDTYRKNLNACIASCMKHGYILQLQTHKIIGLE